MQEIKDILSNHGFNFFASNDAPVLLINWEGLLKHNILVCYEYDGRIVQLRTHNWFNCPKDHNYLLEVLKVISDVNYQMRLAKIGWSSETGDINADYHIILDDDGTLTSAQFHAILSVFLSVIDVSIYRLKETMETGIDPGDEEYEKMKKEMSSKDSAEEDEKDDDDYV